MEILKILDYLDQKEIDYRLVSNHCCGYVFYFLDGAIYPRRYHDNELDKATDFKVASQSVENLIETTLNVELKKDWIHRIEGKNIMDTFKQVEDYLFCSAT